MAQRFFALRTGWLGMRFARKHRHDGLGVIAVRCLRCSPMEYEASPQNLPYAGPTGPPLSDVPLRLADLQAQNMDARFDGPAPPQPPPL
jgi:hypothetical protein